MRTDQKRSDEIRKGKTRGSADRNRWIRSGSSSRFVRLDEEKIDQVEAIDWIDCNDQTDQENPKHPRLKKSIAIEFFNRRLSLCKIQSIFFNRIYAFEIQLKLVLKFNRFCPSFLLVCVISIFLACMRSSLGLSSPQVQLGCPAHKLVLMETS